MNLANKLTLIRVILVPFFLLFMYIDVPCHFLIALVIGVFAVGDRHSHSGFALPAKDLTF